MQKSYDFEKRINHKFKGMLMTDDEIQSIKRQLGISTLKILEIKKKIRNSLFHDS